MKHDPIEYAIFERGSKTYFTATKLFPAAVRSDVFRLYSFVRIADDYVDSIPADAASFHALVDLWETYRHKSMTELRHETSDDVNVRVVKNICQLSISYGFEQSWIESFLHSMNSDLKKKTYKTPKDTLEYVYGSAEVIGFMMARILRLPEEAYEAAALQGRAMQYINFLRDIDEDLGLQRCYFAQSVLREHGLKSLVKEEIIAHSNEFTSFMRSQLELYEKWQHQADSGMHLIPMRYRLAIRTAVDGYNWTARQITKNPMIVYERKVKPTKQRLLLQAGTRLLRRP